MLVRVLPIAVAIAGLAGLFASLHFSASADSQSQAQTGGFKMVLPALASDGQAPPPPVPTPTPTVIPVYQGAISGMYLSSAGLNGQYVIEKRHTFLDGGRERFQDPTLPQRIAWYNQFGQPGTPGINSLLAGHIDYVNYGAGPFYAITSAKSGDTLTLVMDNGLEYRYTVQTVQTINLNVLDMQQVVYPPLAPNRERITLISCGGTFVPYPGGGGEYNSRVILVAERIHE